MLDLHEWFPIKNIASTLFVDYFIMKQMFTAHNIMLREHPKFSL